MEAAGQGQSGGFHFDPLEPWEYNMSAVVKSRDMLVGQAGIVVGAGYPCDRRWCGSVVKKYDTDRLEILRPDGGQLMYDYTVLLIDEDPDDLVRSDEAAPGRYRIVGPADKDTVARDGGAPHKGATVEKSPYYLRRPGSTRLFSGLYYLVPISSPKAGTSHTTCHDEHNHVETHTMAPVTVSVRPDDEFAHMKRVATEFVPGVAIGSPRVELASVPRKQGQAYIRIGHLPTNDLQTWRPDTLRKAARFFNELADHLEDK